MKHKSLGPVFAQEHGPRNNSLPKYSHALKVSIQKCLNFLPIKFLYVKRIAKGRFIRIFKLIRARDDDESTRAKYSFYLAHHGLVLCMMLYRLEAYDNINRRIVKWNFGTTSYKKLQI